MSFHRGPKRPLFDLEPDIASPLAVAVSSADRETLAMVRAALTLRRMRLAFQPAVYSADTSIIGFYEGYIRLLDPSDRVIPAKDFMEVAETQELGREIDVAALQLGLLTLQRNPGIRIAVNMSARSVGYKPWTHLLRQALRAHPGLGRGLILEISEASAMQMPDVLRPFMEDLRPEGIAFTLDDFGAGATSLLLLRDFAFDIAKIDGRFVRGIERQSGNQQVVKAAIALAREFGMFLVAEAVETPSEANWLRDHGVGCLQGYLFGAPEVNPDFTRFRNGRKPD
ncbi:EAL domain-containing protein [Rhodobacter sp. Har01]|uniref:EAL domain-containing protein n=1 Tax=Rhodobacter sp. Har01 TaxID=2883999 RepID=UPI001D062B49|nr:EAL domain-containing protein [Rhodobacter sp. Har01]MCB6179442.1 EAL domain-containing protein [Rhodobacter sp. Har01]